MTTPNITDFYRYSVPRGLNVKQKEEWTTTSSSSIVITAAANRVYFIQGIEFYLSPDADFGANTITVTSSSITFAGVNSSIITFSSVEELMTSWAPATENTVACQSFGTFIFDIPILMNPADTLTIAYSGGTGGITAGGVRIGVSGWHIASTDL